jgi:YYY domain-containing protein
MEAAPQVRDPFGAREARSLFLPRTTRRELAALLVILCIAAALRLTGLDWDDGHHLHPDERFLTMVASDVRLPHSATEYFDTARSPLNPANVGRSYFTYGTLPLFVVRAAADAAGAADYDRIPVVGRALASLFDIATLLFAWMIARRLGGARAGLAALALLACSVISIQQAHFFTVDSFAACFATAALLVLVAIAFGAGLPAHAAFGVAVGLMLACRINLLVLAGVYPIVLVVLRVRDGVRVPRLATGAVLAAITAGLAFRVFQPYAFAGSFWSVPALAPAFVQSMRTIFAFSTGAADFPPSVQWIGRLPVLFPGWNLLVWGLGPAFGVAALCAIAWSLAGRVNADERRERTAARLVVLWAATLFFFQATQFVATLRYFLPVVPALAIVTGSWFASGRRRLHLAMTAVVVLFTAGWAVAFTSIYRHPHTRVFASAWMYDALPPGATIATEHWDDALPLALASRTPDRYEHVELTLYDEETEAKRAALIAALDKADVVVLSSNRLYRSIPRAPWRYPVARRYYELLFSGQLGFRLERVFASYPRLGSLEIADDDAEEAFTVYDHPKVLVFRKTAAYSHDRVAAELDAVSLAQLKPATPREASALYRQVRPTEVPLPGERAARSPLPSGATGSIEATIRWLGALELLSLAIWILGLRWWSTAWPDGGYGFSKILAWLAPATIVWLLAAYGVADVGAAAARGAAIAIVAVAAAVCWMNRARLRFSTGAFRRAALLSEAVFLSGFVLFLGVRAWTPAIAWGEKPMDFAILNAILRSPAVPPADPWYAGASLNYFYFGHFVTAVSSQVSGVPPEIAFNLAIATIAALLAVAGLMAARQISGRAGVGLGAAAAVLLLGNFAGPRLFFSTPSARRGFDYFWATSRVIPGTINEYPPWSLAFADLHAHVLAMPLELTLLALGVTWFALKGDRSRRPRVLLIVASAWVLGALAITSSWSALTAAAAQFVFLLTAWRSERSGLRGMLRMLATWATIVAGALLLFLPFWSRYLAPAAHWGFVRDEAAGAADVLTIFGPLFVLGAPLLLARHFRSGTRPVRMLLAIAFVALPLTAGLLRSPACGVFTAVAVIGCSRWVLDEDTLVQAAAACFALAGVVGVMTECVFLWDRMNTVFKFYLQMWLLLTPAAVALAAVALRRAHGVWRVGAAAIFSVSLLAALFTTATGVVGRLRDPRVPSPHPTLDGFAYLRERTPQELDAYDWINRNVAGIPVVLEAHGASYQEFSRVSMNTGLPTVVGWEYHLFQQGRPQDQIDARAEDVRELYETSNLDRARQLLDQYHVDLVVVGPLERQTYEQEGLGKFASWDALRPVFENDSVNIYATRALSATVRTSVRPVAPSMALGRLREPRGIARAADGTFAVADFGNRRIVLTDAAGTPGSQFGREGSAPGEFRDPCAVVFDADGTLVVADTWNHRIQRLTRGGRMLSEWRADLFGPRGIARASDGSFYVTDTGHHRVVRFARDGAATEVVAPGVLENPVGIAVGAEGEIFVADVGHSRIAVFSPDGALSRSWALEGWSVKAYVEPQVALGPDGVLWVTDPAAGRVLLFDQDGRPLGAAKSLEPLGTPTGIAIVDAGTAMIADARQNRLVRVSRETPRYSGLRDQTPTRKSPAR